MTLSQAAKVLPGRPCVQTILRWIRCGVKAAGGCRVKLAGRKCGSRWYVTPAAIEKFQQDSTAGRVKENPDAPARPSRASGRPELVEGRRARIPARTRRANHRRAVVNLQRQGLMD